MRSKSLTMFAFTLASVAMASTDNHLIRLNQVQKGPDVRVIGTNTAKVPIVAYVVVEESPHSRVVWKAVYSAGDGVKPGKSVDVGNLAKAAKAETKLQVDYIRLANGTTWGDASTDEAKQIAAQFQK